jgi:hypothetical protein
MITTVAPATDSASMHKQCVLVWGAWTATAVKATITYQDEMKTPIDIPKVDG